MNSSQLQNMFRLPTCNFSCWNSSLYVLWKLLQGIGVCVPFVFQTTPQSRSHAGLNRNSMLTTNTGSLFYPLGFHLCLHKNMYNVASSWTLLKKSVQPLFCSYLRKNLISYLCHTYFILKTGVMIHVAFTLKISYSIFQQTTNLHNILTEIHVVPVCAFYHRSLNKYNHSERRHLTDQNIQKSMWLCAHHWLFILLNCSQ
jgi:hypothetical protein